MADVHGFIHDRYAAVKKLFADNLDTGVDLGASFAVTLKGELVIDLWGGYADQEKTRPWEKDTIANVYSVSKTMTALVALLIADRGELDFDAPVARYWPEFAAARKAAVKVSHLMSHSAGLSGWKEPIGMETLYDWDEATALLAAQAPYWEPGTASGYHALTQGFLVGEIVRRITGKTLGTVFREEIAEPLGADFHIGLPAAEDHRVADLVEPPEGSRIFDGDQNELQANMSRNPLIEVAPTRTRAWRGAEIPAANGTGNARAVALIHSILANGGMAKGRRFLSERGCRKALELQIAGTDLILAMPVRIGMGFGLPSDMVPLPSPNSLFWPGYGGSLVLIDMDAHTSMAFVMNKMAGSLSGDSRAFGLAAATWHALGLA